MCAMSLKLYLDIEKQTKRENLALRVIGVNAI